MLVPVVVAAPPPPIVRGASIQDSPVALSIAPRAGTKRLTCRVDSGRAKPCARNATFRLAPGRHTVRVFAVDVRGHAGKPRTMTVVVPRPAPPAIRVGGEPVGIAAGIDGRIWVSGGSSGDVTAIDATTRRVAATVHVGGQLGGIATATHAVWVSVFDGGSVVRIDPAGNTVVQRIAVGGQPTAILQESTGPLWVGNLAGYVTRLDFADTVKHFLLPSGVSTLLGTPNLIWAGLQNGSAVAFDRATTGLNGSPVSVAPDIDAIADSPSGLWVSTFGGTAALIDRSTRAVEHRVKLPSRGSGISSANGSVWVSAYDSGLVVELDEKTGVLLGAVHTGAEPRESIVAGNTLWVVNQADGTVTPIPIGS